MKLSKLVYWYQKKIGTYDKQQWEKTVEQRILGGFMHVPMKTAKLKTEFIDVDLVRGSSFPKAKPKHGLSTVTYLALQRLLFLPLYGEWWIKQTSYRVFVLFLFLYSLQCINVCLYFGYWNKETDYDISFDVLIPFIMMLVLCIVHSHIVSTNTGVGMNYCNTRQKFIRRTRHRRSRFGKSRNRQILQSKEDAKSSQDPEEIPNSVRFAKSVTIDNSIGADQSQQHFQTTQTSHNSESQILVNKDIFVSETDNILEPLIQVEDIENVEICHQDDDGFESLNGNGSSDNDKSTSRSKIPNSKNDVEIISNEANEIQESNNQTLSTSQFSEVETTKPVKKFCDKDEKFYETASPERNVPRMIVKLKNERQRTCESEEEGECEETVNNHLTEATTSATEWMGVTTNSDDYSYSSELEESNVNSETNLNYGEYLEHPFSWEFEFPSSTILNSSGAASDRVSCTIWTRRDIKKAELSVLDVSSAIIAKVESMPENMNYFYGGIVLSIILCLVPSIRRLSDHLSTETGNNITDSLMPSELIQVNLETYTDILCRLIGIAFGTTFLERVILIISTFQRLLLSCLLFFLLTVAEQTYEQRLLYAKLFSHLTSSRRARKSELPHFRLNKVRNIKTWLSIRSYLKRRGPQRSVDVIVSAVFIMTLLLLSFVSLELIKDLESFHSQYNIEALSWSFSLGIFILRFMTLGTKINKKYRNLSVLITEQINLYLQIEQKPHKKDELMVANSVLKLAADLIKELESPFKISGLSANPYLYTITKVVLLSALSGVLSELLGFKLKLHKIKIK